MFMCIDKPRDQKELFFTLNKALKVHSEQLKIRGCYAIYKDDICLYVGQSSNVPSRLATHLCGKYKIADKVCIYEDFGDGTDLIQSEKFLIQKLTPVENILADYTEILNYDLFLDLFKEYADGGDLYSSYEIIVDTHSLLVSDGQIPIDLMYGKNIQKEIFKHSTMVQNYEH